jgi:hypothetical protein
MGSAGEEKAAGGDLRPNDDVEIAPDSLLIRHICGLSNHVIWDDNRNCRRISTAAFSASSDDPRYGMSVDIGQFLMAANLPLDAMVEPGFGAVSLRVGPVRSTGLFVGADPIPRDNAEGLKENPYHGQVWGVKSPSHRRKLHKLVEDWVLKLHDVALR